MPLDNSAKLKMCETCARSLISKYRNPRIEHDELVNIGFAGIASNERSLAFSQAYLHMLNFINRKLPQCKPDVRFRYYRNEPELWQLIDLKDAVAKLTPSERQLIKEYFYDGLTYEQMAILHNKKCRGSIGWSINRILRKLERFLR